MFNSNTLFASLFWGSIGVGMFIYGKRQRAMFPLAGGLVLIAISYFASALWMTLLGILVIAAVYYLRRYE
jgi:hypothetical protein